MAWGPKEPNAQVRLPARFGALRRCLEAAPEAPQPTVAAPKSAPPPEGRTRILVVDDSKLNRRMLEVGLTKSGFDVEVAEDGAQAVEKCHGTDFDLVLMDVQMPVMDGHEATRRLRAELPVHPRLMALTAHATLEDQVDCMRAGMDEYLTKPIRIPDLVKRLKQCGISPG